MREILTIKTNKMKTTKTHVEIINEIRESVNNWDYKVKAVGEAHLPLSKYQQGLFEDSIQNFLENITDEKIIEVLERNCFLVNNNCSTDEIIKKILDDSYISEDVPVYENDVTYEIE